METNEARSIIIESEADQELHRAAPDISGALFARRTRHSVNLLWWLFLAAVLVAMFYGFKFPLNEPDEPVAAQEPGTIRDEKEAFLALAFDDISTTEKSGLTPAALRGQLLALRRGGFSVVRLKDIDQFLMRHSPLPRQPVLLTFDEPSQDAVEIADQELASFGVTGVMFLDANVIEQGNVRMPPWHRLKQLLASGRWEIGLIGCFHRGLETEASVALTTQTQTYLRERDLVRKRLDFPVQVVQCPHPGSQNAEANWEQALRGGSFPLGFVTGSQGANYWDDSSLALKRIRVSRDWDGPTLLSKLEAYAPRREPFVDDFSSQQFAAVWLPTTANLIIENGVLQLSAPPGKKGSVFVLGGSERWRDAYTEVRLAGTPQGQFWIYLRYAQGAPSVRLGVANDQVLLEESTVAGKYHKLGSQTIPAGDTVLSLRVAGLHAVARVNGKSLVQRPVRLPPIPERGALALEVWDPTGKALTRIQRVEAAAALEKYLIVPVGFGSPLWTQLRQQVDDVSALTPTYYHWPRSERKEHLVSDPTVGIFAKYNHLQLLPGLLVANQTPLSETSELCSQALQWAADPAYDGINLIVDPSKITGKWATVLCGLQKKMALQGKTLTVTVLGPSQKQAIESEIPELLPIYRNQTTPGNESLQPLFSESDQPARQER